VQIEVLGTREVDRRQLGILEPVDLPVTDLIVVRRPTDHVERTPVVGQAVGIHIVRDRLGRLKRLVGLSSIPIISSSIRSAFFE